ncbi:hypothetical protein WR25_18946 isoform D [Diploscapter pachys]|uniref:RING-type domain-containing protein n=1 Tax=Diploscapter pachys TaxID=2018661 RepID=A0A2A2K962_9BILA|nr:hypothetical protein WR25_18946 isoform D [Diploscapter pachys]
MALHDDIDFELEMALAANQDDDEEAFILRQIELINAMEGRNQPETINRNTNEHNRPLVDNGQRNTSTSRSLNAREKRLQENIEVTLAAQRKLFDESIRAIKSSKTSQAVKDKMRKSQLLDVLKQKFSSVNEEFLEAAISWFPPVACFLIANLVEIGMEQNLMASNESRLLTLFEYPTHSERGPRVETNCEMPEWMVEEWHKYIDIVKKDYATEVSQFECQVCFDTHHIANGVYCASLYEEQFINDFDGITRDDGHRVCADCLREMAKAASDDAAIAKGGVGLKCVDPDCSGVILYAHVSPYLHDEEVRSRLHKRLQQEAIVVLQGLESCKKCQYTMQIEIPKEELQTFQCPECQAEFCRTCKIDWKDHVNNSGQAKRCEDVMSPEDYKRIKLEEQLTNAVLRQCECGASFIKTEGCNKMTCRLDLQNNVEEGVIE